MVEENLNSGELIIESLMFQLNAPANALSEPYDNNTTEYQTSDGWKYYKNSKNELHNIKGPAIITSEKTGSFFINGIELDLHDWLRYADISDNDKAYMLFVTDNAPVKLGP